MRNEKKYPTPCTCCGNHRRVYSNGWCGKCLRESGLQQCHGPCGQILPLLLSFYGRNRWCKDCHAQKSSQWAKNNPERWAAIKSKHRAAHKDAAAAYERRHRQESVNYRIGRALRERLRKAIKTIRAGSAVRDLGCTIAELRAHLEAKFQPGMNWENYGEWHIDHVRPLASFNLTDRTQFLQACHYTNLQPLWALENWRKGKLKRADLHAGSRPFVTRSSAITALRGATDQAATSEPQ